jgi:hypothetical protein
MRILITGSRTWTQRKPIHEALTVEAIQARSSRDQLVVIHGGANGADSVAEAAVRRLWQAGWPITSDVYHAQWKLYGKRAGSMRNELMVAQKPDLCLAFIHPCAEAGCRRKPKIHDSHGAGNCIALVAKAGIPTKIVRSYEPATEGEPRESP